MISKTLKEKFEKIIEFDNIDWKIIEHIVQKDANILRPIKGVAFEEYFKKILRKKFPNIDIKDGEGDSDIDLYVNGHKLQLKTAAKDPTIENRFVGVALHKTHGLEKRPHNLYKISAKTFDFLVLQHPISGIFIIPYEEIKEHNSWPGYLDDPAKIPWNSARLNNWKLIGLNEVDGISIDDRTPPKKSELPFLSKETFLEDFEIIETLCKPEYFRAAVMGLKGNIKEHWFEVYLKKLGYKTTPPVGSYPKYDLAIEDKFGVKKRVQTKGTSKNMCDLKKNTIGVEIMGTHGRFPNRGYKKDVIDYVAVIISSHQLSSKKIKHGLHFIILPVEDLPLHYKIGKGIEFNEPLWNKEKYSNVIYPNIKLKLKNINSKNIEFVPDLSSYGKSNGYDVIPIDSEFRKAGPYLLDSIPNQFHSSKLLTLAPFFWW
jgi:hypothetical protein